MTWSFCLHLYLNVRDSGKLEHFPKKSRAENNKKQVHEKYPVTLMSIKHLVK